MWTAASTKELLMWDDLASDLRYSLRNILRQPTFSAIAVLVLALAIGANTAIFSIVHTVLLRPLPYDAADRLVVLWSTSPSVQRVTLTPGRFLDFREQASSVASFAGISHIPITLTSHGDPARLRGSNVSRNFFEVLGVVPALGQTFAGSQAAERLAMLSDGLWRRQFGGDSAIVGQSVTLNDTSYVVVGVMPPTFVWPNVTATPVDFAYPEIWIAAGTRDLPILSVANDERFLTDRRTGYLRAVGRLTPGVSLAHARDEIDRIAARLANEHPDTDAGRGAVLVPLGEQFLGNVRPPLYVLAAAVGFVLIIACANIASLLLTRASSRQRELAVRVALGASRGRLIRQLVADALVLSTLSAVIGTLFAAWAITLLVSLSPQAVLRLEDARLDGITLLFTIGLATLTGAFFGWLPGLLANRTVGGSPMNEGPSTLLRGGRSSEGRRGRRAREALVIAQIMVTLVLLVGAGLLLRSFVALQHVTTGLDPRNLLTFDLFLGDRGKESAAQQTAFYEDVRRGLSSMAGVESAALVVTLPIGGDNFGGEAYAEGEAAPLPGHERRVGLQVVSPGYFRTLGTPFRSGRDVDVTDTAETSRVAVINETLARQLWPGEDDIVGRRFRTSSAPGAPWVTLIGVVGDVRHLGPASPPRPEFFLPYFQQPFSFMAVVVRTTSDNALQIAPEVRRHINQLRPTLALSGVATMEQHLYRSTLQPRFLSMIVGSFGALALVLSALGIYGTLAYSVTQRLREIGVRMALGAQRSDVLSLILRRGLLLSSIGVTLGLIGSIALTRALAGLLFEIRPSDPVTYGSAAIGFFGIATLASLVPALRASRVDTIATLRGD